MREEWSARSFCPTLQATASSWARAVLVARRRLAYKTRAEVGVEMELELELGKTLELR